MQMMLHNFVLQMYIYEVWGSTSPAVLVGM